MVKQLVGLGLALMVMVAALATGGTSSYGGEWTKFYKGSEPVPVADPPCDSLETMQQRNCKTNAGNNCGATYSVCNQVYTTGDTLRRKCVQGGGTIAACMPAACNSPDNPNNPDAQREKCMNNVFAAD